jgi:hypothetical protein
VTTLPLPWRETRTVSSSPVSTQRAGSAAASVRIKLKLQKSSPVLSRRHCRSSSSIANGLPVLPLRIRRDPRFADKAARSKARRPMHRIAFQFFIRIRYRVRHLEAVGEKSLGDRLMVTFRVGSREMRSASGNRPRGEPPLWNLPVPGWSVWNQRNVSARRGQGEPLFQFFGHSFGFMRGPRCSTKQPCLSS